MGTTAWSLAALKVSVGSRGAALTRHEDVGVHAEAHGAAGLAPLKAGVEEDLVEAFLLRLGLDDAGARHHHRPQRVGHLLAANDGSSGAQVFDTGVGAGADKDA